MKESITDVTDDYKHWTFPEVTSGKIIECSRDQPKEKNKNRVESKQDELEKPVDDIDPDLEDVADVEEDIAPLISAEALKKLTDEAYQEAFDQGKADGYKLGLAEGEKAGLAAGEDAIKDKLSRLDTLLQALLLPLKGEQEKIEKTVLAMVCELVKAVVHTEVDRDSSLIIDTVKRSLLALPHMTNQLSLYVHSQDHALIKDSGLLDDFDAHIIDDDNLLPGGCRLVSTDTSVDFTVDNRLRIILDEFIEQSIATRSESSNDSKEKAIPQKTDLVSDDKPEPSSKDESDEC